MGRYNLKKSEHDDGATFEKLPEGIEYLFQITDYKETNKDGGDLVTKNGDPMVNVTLEVVEPEQYAGKKVWHNVCFFQPNSPSIKGIGMTRHFLHCIGKTWEGDLSADPSSWVPRRLKATVIHNGDYVNLDEIILDESLFGTAHAKVEKKVTDPKDIAWDE